MTSLVSICVCAVAVLLFLINEHIWTFISVHYVFVVGSKVWRMLKCSLKTAWWRLIYMYLKFIESDWKLWEILFVFLSILLQVALWLYFVRVEGWNVVSHLIKFTFHDWSTVEPWCKKFAVDRANLFVKWRVCYIENLNITNRGNGQKVRYIKVVVNDWFVTRVTSVTQLNDDM